MNAHERSSASISFGALGAFGAFALERFRARNAERNGGGSSEEAVLDLVARLSQLVSA